MKIRAVMIRQPYILHLNEMRFPTNAFDASLHPITPSHHIIHHPVINTSLFERSATPLWTKSTPLERSETPLEDAARDSPITP